MTITPWSAAVGERGYTVRVAERPDRGMAVYLTWGKPRQSEKANVGTVRDARGRVQQKKVAAALAEALEKSEELQGKRPTRDRSGPMTLGLGVERAFSMEGCFPGDVEKDAYTRETKKRVDDAVTLLGGPKVLWEEITPGAIRGIWRRIEKRYGDGRGRNKAEKTVTNLLTIAGWLAGEFPDQRFPRGPRHWRRELRDHWKKQGHDVEQDEPRHTEAEIALILANREKADPRLRLALYLATGLRGGQAVRTMRSHCTQVGGRWRVAVPWLSDKKRAPTLFLSPSETSAFEEAITTGHLSDLEAAYRAGELADYPLFPAGRLRKGKARVRDTLHPMEQPSLVDLLRNLEEEVGIPFVARRGWHGLRRGLADFYDRLLREGKIHDPNLLNEIQGWVRGSKMRERVYLDQEGSGLREEASRVRDLRPGFLPRLEGESTTESATNDAGEVLPNR